MSANHFLISSLLLAATAGMIGCASTPPLIAAVNEQNPDKVRGLIAGGAPVNALNAPQTESSALMQAAKTGNVEIVRLLIESGADASALTRNARENAISWAAVGETLNPELFRLLIEHGADPFVRDWQGKSGYEKIMAAPCDGKPGVYETRALLQREAARRGVSAPGSAPASAPVPPAAPAPAFIAEPSAAYAPAAPEIKPRFSGGENPEDYAVVVGIEKYEELPEASYAERDARAARGFFRALGVPERNIMTLTGSRATRTGLEKAFEAWLPNNVSEKSRVYVFYSGHGAPDPKTKDAYLVPSDGDPQYLAQTGYPLKRLYAKLGELKAKSILVALDSCFSGAGGRSVLAKGTRPLVGKVDLGPKADAKISVLAASAGDQISGSDETAKHGLFTYNLLNGLNGAAKDAKGQVTLKSLYDHLRPKVQDEARRANREQTPQLQCLAPEAFVLRAK